MIVSSFVREQKRYTKNEIQKIFHITSIEADKLISKLKAFGTLKLVKNSTEQKSLADLAVEHIEEVDSFTDDFLYVFTYVGVITVGNIVIKCYPKYLLDATEPIDELKQVLKVVNRYNSKEQVINSYYGNSGNSSFNLLGVILFLLDDYHEYGVYNNEEEIIELNGEGEIVWDRTISVNIPFIKNNQPYYMEMYTRRSVENDLDFFKLLHECILSLCSNYLNDTGLNDIFDMTTVNLSDNTLDEFGDKKYILHRLNLEIDIQFNTRKRQLLQTLYSFIEQNQTNEGSQTLSMYGTNSFNLIWEDVCSQVFGNKLQSQLKNIDIPCTLNPRYGEKDRLIDIIKNPEWHGTSTGGENFVKTAPKTLIPDVITISKQSDWYTFWILDAKYYNIQLEKEKVLKGQPGIEDVTKQYLYQLAYKEFIELHSFDCINNVFLTPIQNEALIKKGFVRMEMLGNLGLKDIQVIQLPTCKMFDYYLKNKQINLSELVI